MWSLTSLKHIVSAEPGRRRVCRVMLMMMMMMTCRRMSADMRYSSRAEMHRTAAAAAGGFQRSRQTSAAYTTSVDKTDDINELLSQFKRTSTSLHSLMHFSAASQLDFVMMLR